MQKLTNFDGGVVRQLNMAWIMLIARTIELFSNENAGVPREASSREMACRGWTKVLEFAPGFDPVKFRARCGLPPSE